MNKIDSVDARQIAEYAYRFEDELPLWTPPEATREQVRVLLRTREQLTRDMVGKKNMLHAMRRKVVRTPFAEELLEESVDQIKVQIKRIQKEIGRLVQHSSELAETMALLQSIPGVGPVLSAHLLVTTNAFKCTPTARQFVAYIGICPYEHQSGTSVQKKATSRRYGPPVLLGATLPGGDDAEAIRSALRRHYLRKRAEGKPARLVLNNISNKLLRIICAVLRSGRQPYYETHRSVNPNLLQTS